VTRRRAWACALLAAALAAVAGCDLSGGAEQADRPASLAPPGADRAPASPQAPPRAARDRDAVALVAVVERVIDGDTIRVRARGFQDTVRLIGIDTPETRHPARGVECFGPQASARAARLLAPGRAVALRGDPTQAVRDRYGRLLAYVYADSRRGAASVNRALVASGHARVYVHGGVRFRYADAFEAAQRAARRAARGLWGPPCDGRREAPRRAAPASGCDPAYAGACIPPPPPDLDCADIPERRFRSVGADPHRLDGDGNGIACERG
jgi:micrococcal nuclease